MNKQSIRLLRLSEILRRIPYSEAHTALRGPWTSGLAAMHPAPVASGDDGVLARSAFARFRMAPLARPVRAEPRATAGFDELFSVS